LKSMNWDHKIRISFVDEYGMEEVGIDGGGKLHCG
jgi:hypothetical protein